MFHFHTMNSESFCCLIKLLQRTRRIKSSHSIKWLSLILLTFFVSQSYWKQLRSKNFAKHVCSVICGGKGVNLLIALCYLISWVLDCQSSYQLKYAHSTEYSMVDDRKLEPDFTSSKNSTVHKQYDDEAGSTKTYCLGCCWYLKISGLTNFLVMLTNTS